jgi:hypothetical protein
MDGLSELSSGHIVLLYVHYASESNADALRALGAARGDVFGSKELPLRIILSYFPESAEPALYGPVADEITRGAYSQQEWLDAQHLLAVDISPIEGISPKKANRRAKTIESNLLPLDHPSCPASLCPDLLTRFVIHRAHRIDTQTGLLTLIPPLAGPFLPSSQYLNDWFISSALPLLRFGYEYYPDPTVYSLDRLESADGEQGVEMLLAKTAVKSSQDQDSRMGNSEHANFHGATLGRDLKGLVGPWMYGYSQRKYRRLKQQPHQAASKHDLELESDRNVAEELQQLSEGGTDHDWENAFSWLTRKAVHDFAVVAEAIEDWSGPVDVDLGGYHEGPYLEDDLRRQLHLRYVQTAFASVLAAEAATRGVISSAHSVLVRIAALMDYEPPPELVTSVELLPRVDSQKSVATHFSRAIFELDALLKPGHPFTVPNLESFAFLQLLVYSAYLLADLGHNTAVSDVAKIRFHHDADEQFAIVQRTLHALASGQRKDEQQWVGIRNRLIWLWNWGMDRDEDAAQYGSGVFGKTDRAVLEKEILKALLNSASYSLIVSIYVQGDSRHHRITSSEVQATIISSAMNHYDNASNGNRTRGGMKKASDIVTSLRKYFPKSAVFQQCEALLAATHALSFYSLTLQHGVPFLPVNIRVSSDPISLIEKLLSQNPRSYTHVDDLITIGKNFVTAGLVSSSTRDAPPIEPSASELTAQKHKVERRVIGMAIEAALHENDFETAYSYVVNKLDTTSSTLNTSSSKDQDDISWRAALAAGRHKSSASSLSTSSSLSTPPALRRLEQRMELLSQALLLAPPSALPEVLNVWRKCEEEMTALQAREAEIEASFDDHADRGLPGAFVNATAPVQPRREVGRGANEEAPMGLFDVARGAAAAFSKSAFPLRGAAASSPMPPPSSRGHTRQVSSAASDAGSVGSDGLDNAERVRKRDLVANAVTGGLASGIGWVLGKSISSS